MFREYYLSNQSTAETKKFVKTGIQLVSVCYFTRLFLECYLLYFKLGNLIAGYKDFVSCTPVQNYFPASGEQVKMRMKKISSLSEDIQDLPGCFPVQPVWLDLISRGSFQPLWFCDSTIACDSVFWRLKILVVNLLLQQRHNKFTLLSYPVRTITISQIHKSTKTQGFGLHLQHMSVTCKPMKLHLTGLSWAQLSHKLQKEWTDLLFSSYS